jgi:hypothetical protein
MAENKKFSVRTDGRGQNVFVSDVFLLSVPEEERVKVLSINDDGRVVLTTVSGSSGGGTVDTGSLLNNASVSSNTITFTRGNATTFNLTVDTGSGGTTNTGSLITTSSVSLNTITFTKGDASTFDITVDTGSDEFTGTVTSVGGTGTVNGITLSGTVTTSGNLSLGGSVSINNSNWSGTDLSVANGGTGASTFTSNALLTGNGTSAIQSESNLTFNGSTLTVTGGITATIGTGTDNSVVVKNSSNQLVTDEIDPKVWAGNLVDKQGTPVQYQVATFNDSDTLVGSSNLTFDNSTLSITGNVTATSFTGSLSGSATTATTSTTADTASKITIDPVTSTDTTTYPVLVGSNAVGAQSTFIDNANLSYNASTNTLTATTFNGNLTGNAATATSASHADNASQAETASLAINADSSSITDEDGVEGSYYVTFVDNTSGYNNLKIDNNSLTYNPGSNTLTADIFAGSLSGNASTATTATTANTASKITINPVTSTDTTAYPVLVGSNTVGAQTTFIDNVNLSYNASTNALTASTFVGNLVGTALTASYANILNPNGFGKQVGATITTNKDTTTIDRGYFYLMDSSGGTITFTLNAGGASLSGGEEWEFFVLDLTNEINFAAFAGESIISENGLKANSTGSAIVAKFIGNILGTNTWALVGSLQP